MEMAFESPISSQAVAIPVVPRATVVDVTAAVVSGANDVDAADDRVD
jgi:hypothetical protein